MKARNPRPPRRNGGLPILRTSISQAHAFAGGLEIREDGKPVSRIRSAQPAIKRWAFVKDGRQLVVKSCGAEGPPTIELFDSRTAIRRDSIPADQVADGRPAWAAGFAEAVR